MKVTHVAVGYTNFFFFFCFLENYFKLEVKLHPQIFFRTNFSIF